MAAAVCTEPTFEINPLEASVTWGQEIKGTIDAPSNFTVGATLLDPFENFTADIDSFIIAPVSGNGARILFYAVDNEGCSATLVGTYTFLEPPKLDEKPAERNVT
ncbi:hypothetical protein GOV07_03470, partial [Candidatus Woesearchaeota archaeon]|nr:hypothetical protein [Candidatus Woesearchaeota archaeon]